MTVATAANHPMAWADDAACRGLDPAIFFPVGNEEIDPDAPAVCARCDVRGACLDWALRHEQHGYWAGTSERQRRRLRKALSIRLVDDIDEPLTREVS